MIDQIIKASRASFKLEPNKSIYRYFEYLADLVSRSHPGVEKPILKICYSLNRLCETFKFRNKNYIIYDQYLGQSFNKMNRILFYENDNEAFSYLCKILSEENYLVNNFDKALAYNVYYKLHSKAKAKNLPKDFIDKKNEFITIQESFVFFHEFAHSIVSTDPNPIKYAESFITSNSKHLITTIQAHLKSNNEDPKKINYFFEEVACDFLATNFTYVFFKVSYPVKYANILEAISAGFLFLRTIYDIRSKANNLFDDGNSFTFFMKLRYNALRSYFINNEIFSDDSQNLIEIYELWEKKFDMNLILNLSIDFEEKLLEIFKRKDSPSNLNFVKELMGT